MTGRVRVAFTLVVLAFADACSGDPGETRAALHEPPFVAFDGGGSSFLPVARTLDQHCGTIDCHGQVGRNLRLYGSFGMRLAETDTPGCPTDVTAAEAEADYWTVVGLEPEMTATVYAERGGRPERLTVVQKARGAQAHKGGTVFPKGSDGDACLVSFFSGAVDAPSCNNSQRQNGEIPVPLCTPKPGSSP